MIKNIIASVVTSIIVAVLALSVAPSAPKNGNLGVIETTKATFGQGFVTNARSTSIFNGTVAVGSSTAAISKILFGKCNLVGDTSDAVIASGKAAASCNAPGVRAGDNVLLRFSTTTNPNIGSLVIEGASASSTNDYIAATILNASTTATQISRFGTSTQYMIIR